MLPFWFMWIVIKLIIKILTWTNSEKEWKGDCWKNKDQNGCRMAQENEKKKKPVDALVPYSQSTQKQFSILYKYSVGPERFQNSQSSPGTGILIDLQTLWPLWFLSVFHNRHSVLTCLQRMMNHTLPLGLLVSQPCSPS